MNQVETHCGCDEHSYNITLTFAWFGGRQVFSVKRGVPSDVSSIFTSHKVSLFLVFSLFLPSLSI